MVITVAQVTFQALEAYFDVIVFDTGSPYVVTAALNFQSSCLSFLSAGITDVYHHAWLEAHFY
jgi:hypothetical protein